MAGSSQSSRPGVSDSSIVDLDQRLVWHPFTQEKTAPLPLLIKRGKGAYLYDINDAPYLDLVASWWVNLHGHSCQPIADAIHEQALQLEHVIFAGFTHKPAVHLCHRLDAHLGPSLSRYFFSDNGSTAVEVALKMAYQFWWNQGQPQRRLFLTFEGGYHGDTFGAMSVGRTSPFHQAFQDFFFEVKTLPFPQTWTGDDTIDQREADILEQLEAVLITDGQTLAGVLIEPLIQGAGGMRVCRPSFLNQLMALLRAHDVLILFDEVMTGFGRTGTLFAYQQLEDTPDILCLSKGLTGGFLPLALTVTTEAIYQAFQADTFTKALAHGHSYTANPLGCAAALASLNLLESGEVQTQLQALVSAQQSGAQRLQEVRSNRIQKVRHLGTLTAFDWCEADGEEMPQALASLKAEAMEAGMLIRPLGHTVYLLPPYCTPLNSLASVYSWLIERAQR